MIRIDEIRTGRKQTYKNVSLRRTLFQRDGGAQRKGPVPSGPVLDLWVGIQPNKENLKPSFKR